MEITTIFLISALMAGVVPVETQANENQALFLEIDQNAGREIVVLLKGKTKKPLPVSYQLETIGASHSVHKGKTTLSAGQPATLSTVKFSYSDTWCVRLNVVEDEGTAYQLSEGNACN